MCDFQTLAVHDQEPRHGNQGHEQPCEWSSYCLMTLCRRRLAVMMKRRQKASGGFPSEDGAKEFGVMRSLLSAARKQGWDMLKALTIAPEHLIADLRVV